MIFVLFLRIRSKILSICTDIHNTYQPEIQLTRFNVGTIAVISVGKVQSEIKAFCDSVFIFRNKYLKVCDVIFSLRTMRHIFFFLFFFVSENEACFLQIVDSFTPVQSRCSVSLLVATSSLQANKLAQISIRNL